MSMLNHTSSSFITSGAVAGALRSCRAWLGHLINDYIAKVIARREHQAHLFMLRHFSDKELTDIGLNRNQVGEGLAEAAKDRSALQEVRQRQSMMS